MQAEHRLWRALPALVLVALCGIGRCAVGEPASVIVFRDMPSWNRTPDFEDALRLLSIPSATQSSKDLENFSVTAQTIVIAGGQDGALYAALGHSLPRIEEFVRGGGTLVVEANGAERYGLELPGEVKMVRHPAVENLIVMPRHPALLPFLGHPRITATLASHGYFSHLPAGTQVLVSEMTAEIPTVDARYPTFVEYAYGKGRVIAAAQCFHDLDGSGRAVLMPTLLRYATQRRWISDGMGHGTSKPAVADEPDPPLVQVTRHRSGITFGPLFVGPDGELNAPNRTLRVLVSMASGVQPWRVVDGPTWIDFESFDLTLSAAGAKQPPDLESGRQPAIQAAIDASFQLQTHRAMRSLSGLTLRVDGQAGQFRRAKPAVQGEFQGIAYTQGQLIGRGAPILRVVQFLERITGQHVLDTTELEGLFDFELQWQPQLGEGADIRWDYRSGSVPAISNDSTAKKSLNEAMKSEWGISMSPGTALTDVVVIDAAREPKL